MAEFSRHLEVGPVVTGFYCGVSGNTFDAMVRAGELPAPDANGRYDLKMIDFAIDRRNGLADDPEEHAPDWSIKRRPQPRTIAREKQ